MFDGKPSTSLCDHNPIIWRKKNLWSNCLGLLPEAFYLLGTCVTCLLQETQIHTCLAQLPKAIFVHFIALAGLRIETVEWNCVCSAKCAKSLFTTNVVGITFFHVLVFPKHQFNSTTIFIITQAVILIWFSACHLKDIWVKELSNWRVNDDSMLRKKLKITVFGYDGTITLKLVWLHLSCFISHTFFYCASISLILFALLTMVWTTITTNTFHAVFRKLITEPRSFR